MIGAWRWRGEFTVQGTRKKVIADGIVANPGSKHKAETETLPQLTKMEMEINKDCQLDGQGESPLDLMEIIIMTGDVHSKQEEVKVLGCGVMQG